MTKTIKYDLEERTLKFANKTADVLRKLSKDMITIEYIKQLIRSSSSVGANYIEANEALSKKDFLMRIKISRKEAKESVFWINLLKNNSNSQEELNQLLQEATELKKIFSSILEKSK